MRGRIETLQALHTACWQELQRAATSRGHAWRVLTLATATESGEVDARSVILREAEPSRKELTVYTDSRSPKIRQLRARPAAVLVAWSPELSWQLRLRVNVDVVTDGLGVSSRWARVKLSRSAQDYLGALPPGTPVNRYEPERGTREHFAVLHAHVQSIDWLELAEGGHRRASFDDQGARWLAP